MAQITGLVVIVACLNAGVHAALVAVVAGSFDAIPLGAGFTFGHAALSALVRTFAGALAAGVVYGLPFLFLAVCVDAALGFAGRLTPGFTLSPHAMHLKNALALALMVVLSDRIAAGCGAWAQRIVPAVSAVVGAVR